MRGNNSLHIAFVYEELSLSVDNYGFSPNYNDNLLLIVYISIVLDPDIDLYQNFMVHLRAPGQHHGRLTLMCKLLLAYCILDVFICNYCMTLSFRLLTAT